mmetsp:Transcript_47184/g.106912  ORF Transcript_47184/g.106912 Transcript_47184/m.106912 type:complete len:218 (-) Transcript_47184:709-1362(-)
MSWCFISAPRGPSASSSSSRAPAISASTWANSASTSTSCLATDTRPSSSKDFRSRSSASRCSRMRSCSRSSDQSWLRSCSSWATDASRRGTRAARLSSAWSCGGSLFWDKLRVACDVACKAASASPSNCTSLLCSRDAARLVSTCSARCALSSDFSNSAACNPARDVARLPCADSASLSQWCRCLRSLSNSRSWLAVEAGVSRWFCSSCSCASSDPI